MELLSTLFHLIPGLKPWVIISVAPKELTLMPTFQLQLNVISFLIFLEKNWELPMT
jgi:hypothetical protein